MKKLFYFIFIAFLFSNCKTTQKVSDKKIILWYHDDYHIDNVLGISLKKLYDSSVIHKKSSKEIIVATLDNLIDTNHEDLKEVIWTNKKKSPITVLMMIKMAM